MNMATEVFNEDFKIPDRFVGLGIIYNEYKLPVLNFEI